MRTIPWRESVHNDNLVWPKKQGNALTPVKIGKKVAIHYWWWWVGVAPLRGFPVERRGIGHLVPILGGRWLAEVVPLVGGACPSGYWQVDKAVHLVGPVPTPHGALGGRQASEGCGPASGASSSAQPSAGRKKAWWLTPDTTSQWCGEVAESWSRSALPALLVTVKG